MNYPCRECNKKYLGCHDHCDEYLKVKAKRDKQKDDKIKHLMFVDAQVKSQRRNKGKRNYTFAKFVKNRRK